MNARKMFVLAALAAVSCIGSVAAQAEPIRVVVTIKPVHSLTAAVMAGVGQPQLLIDGAASPHTFALKPSDARALHAAKVLIRVSETLEPFTARLVRSLPKTVRVVTMERAPGVKLLDVRTGATFEDHDHGHGHGHGHSHGQGHSHGKKGAKAKDGHIWLDPENARVMAAYIAEELAKADPAHAATYRANAAALAPRLAELSREIENSVRPLAGRPFIVFHDAYQYFEKRFGLDAVGSVTVSPEVAPSAKRLRALREKITRLGAVCVFSEPQFEPRIVTTISEGTQARPGVLDPLGAAIPAGPDLYPKLLRALADSLTACLAPRS